MSKAKVSWILCIGRLVSKTDNVIHFARLVKQAGVDLVSWPICLYGAYMQLRLMQKTKLGPQDFPSEMLKTVI